jgi:hypothetical protein
MMRDGNAENIKGVQSVLGFLNMPTLDQLEAAHFEKHLGQIFRAQARDYAASWELMTVTSLGSARANADAGRGRSFSLVFRAPAEHRLPQCIYMLNHPEMGDLDIFMVPIRANRDGFYLEAIFNRTGE